MRVQCQLGSRFFQPQDSQCSWSRKCLGPSKSTHQSQTHDYPRPPLCSCYFFPEKLRVLFGQRFRIDTRREILRLLRKMPPPWEKTRNQ